MTARVLIVAGSDSGGGAGIQADLKTVSMLGGYGATAVTALTAQDTTGVHAVRGIEPDFVRAQMLAVLGDLGADAVKTGMLHRAETIRVVAETLLEHAAGVPLVVDPVLWATSGAALFEPEAVAAYRDHLLRIASVITPNAPEAEALTGLEVRSLAGQEKAARALLELGATAALVKGGHLDADPVQDVLIARTGERVVLSTPRQRTRSTHGTGCTLASALATGLAAGRGLEDALRLAHAYVVEAIRSAPGLGKGHGPLGHTWPLRDLPGRGGEQE